VEAVETMKAAGKHFALFLNKLDLCEVMKVILTLLIFDIHYIKRIELSTALATALTTVLVIALAIIIYYTQCSTCADLPYKLVW
jgi:uncharacterized membrane protein